MSDLSAFSHNKQTPLSCLSFRYLESDLRYGLLPLIDYLVQSCLVTFPHLSLSLSLSLLLRSFFLVELLRLFLSNPLSSLISTLLY